MKGLMITSAALALCLAGGGAGAQPTMTLSTTMTHPTGGVVVGGKGFGDFEGVDIFFDETPLQLVIAGSTGNFSGADIAVPANALPGTHFITALGRHTGEGVQKSFDVATFWQKFGEGSRNQNTNPYENVLSPSTVGGLEPEWSINLGAGNGLQGSPVVYSGRIYATDSAGNVHAVNVTNGIPFWTTTLGGLLTAPTVANNMVYVGSDSQSAQGGTLTALNYANGLQIWSYAVPNGGQIEGAPTVVNGVVYFGDSNGNLYALNASTGALIWTPQPSTNNSYCASPAVVNGVIYINGLSQTFAVNAATGATIWDVATDTNCGVAVTVDNGYVFTGGATAAEALLAADGHVTWQTALPDQNQTFAGFAASNGILYSGLQAATQVPTNVLTAYEPKTGTVVWSASTPGGISTVPVAANGVVYVAGETSASDGYVAAYNAQTGTPLWTSAITAFPGAAPTAPVVVNGMVFVGGGSTLYAYALGAGAAVTPPPQRPSIARLRAIAAKLPH